VAQKGLASQEVKRGAAFGESGQTFEGGAKACSAQTHVSEPQAVKRRGVGRRDVERLFELLDGLLVASQRDKRETVELSRLYHIGFPLQKPLEDGGGLIEFAGAVMRYAEIEQERRQLRRDFERGFVSRDSLVISAEPRQRDSQVGLRVQIIRLDRERGAVF